MPPFKAGGANTGIQSADNLAWKLAAVLNDQAAPALLSTYHTERHPVGRFNAHQSLTGPSQVLLRLDDDPPQLPADEEAPMLRLLAGYQYLSAAVISDETPPADPDAVSLVDGLRGQPGTGVPHAWIQCEGQRVSTLDLLGSGFTMLTGDERWGFAGLDSQGALLVRPDAFVAWRAGALPEQPEAELRQLLSIILARREVARQHQPAMRWRSR
jgi:putative polyketide hydroxylase